MSKTTIYIPWHKEHGYLPVAMSASKEFTEHDCGDGWHPISIPLPEDPTVADFITDALNDCLATWNGSTVDQIEYTQPGHYKLIDWSANVKEEK